MFFICLNCAGITVGYLYSQGVLASTETQTMPYTTSDIENRFNVLSFFNVQNLLYGVIGGAIGGLFGLITRSGVFAVGAILIFVVVSLVPIIGWVLTGFGVMMNVFLAGTGLEFISYIFYSILSVFFFFFLFNVLGQRQDMT